MGITMEVPFPKSLPSPSFEPKILSIAATGVKAGGTQLVYSTLTSEFWWMANATRVELITADGQGFVVLALCYTADLYVVRHAFINLDENSVSNLVPHNCRAERRFLAHKAE